MTKFIDSSLRPINGSLDDVIGLRLTAIMHNEMYFLSDFLEHYRSLGVKSFVFIDDRSTDGSREFALEQDDVLALESNFRFGDWVSFPDGGEHRMSQAWRNSLLELFGVGQWSLHLDMDEFLDLPGGLDLPGLIGEFPNRPGVVWGAMIDMYPQTSFEVANLEASSIHDVSWYFDARPQFKLHKVQTKSPKILYSGSRARFRTEFDLGVLEKKMRHRLKRKLAGNPFPPLGDQFKSFLINWADGYSFKGHHRIRQGVDKRKLAPALPLVLPLRHYKFAADLVRRTEHANMSKGYHNNSEVYDVMGRLLEKFSKENVSLLGNDSRAYRSFVDFYEAGMTKGIDLEGQLNL